jgi:thioredoxin 1
MTKNITSTELEELTAGEKLVMVDMWAPWCGPCKMLGPIIDKLATEYSNVEIVKVNVDEESAASAKYGVRNIPTVLFLKGGEIVDKIVGVAAEHVYKEKLDKLG